MSFLSIHWMRYNAASLHRFYYKEMNVNTELIGSITVADLIVYLILGLLVGSLVGRLVKNRKKGYGITGNLVVGVVGAVIGGLIFDLLDINLLENVQVSGNDFLAAFVGAFIFLGILTLVRRR